MMNKSVLLKELKKIKDNWLEMSSKYSDHKENYSADAYRDCADNIAQFMDKIVKTFIIDTVDTFSDSLNIKNTGANKIEHIPQQTAIQIVFECQSGSVLCDYHCGVPGRQCQDESLFGCENRKAREIALENAKK